MKKKTSPTKPVKKVKPKGELVEKDESKQVGLPNLDLKKFIGCGG